VGDALRGSEADGHADEARQLRWRHGGDDRDVGDVGEVGQDHGPDVGLADDHDAQGVERLGAVVVVTTVDEHPP
jgi:hypothetical protein